MKKGEPITFSSAFGLTTDQVASAGAVDVTLNCDTRLFIDPLLLADACDKSFRKCARPAYEARFGLVIKLLSKSVSFDDKAWKAARKQLSFPEMKYTHLGYAKKRSGSGFGTLLTDELINSAKEVIGLGITDPDLFVALALFEENVGADRISDMTSHIIFRCLVNFTNSAATRLGLPLAKFSLSELDEEEVLLPKNPLVQTPEPVILVPKDVVRNLPTASDWDSVQSAAQETEDLRARVNADIGDIWATKSKKDKVNIRKNITSSKRAFELFLELLSGAIGEPYDLDTDDHGWLYPSDLRKAVSNKFPLDLSAYAQKTLSISDAQTIVRKIIEKYRQLIEDNGLWQLLYDEKSRKPRHERAAQKIFFATASSYCEANNLDLTPEADAGSGPVDFKLSHGSSLKILVEIKKSTNTSIVHGYEKQLEIYKTSEKTKYAHYVVVDVGRYPDNVKRTLKKLHQAALVEFGAGASTLWDIDGTRKSSASKR